jgi:hypothetical protein
MKSSELQVELPDHYLYTGIFISGYSCYFGDNVKGIRRPACTGEGSRANER